MLLCPYKSFLRNRHKYTKQFIFLEVLMTKFYNYKFNLYERIFAWNDFILVQTRESRIRRVKAVRMRHSPWCHRSPMLANLKVKIYWNISEQGFPTWGTSTTGVHDKFQGIRKFQVLHSFEQYSLKKHYQGRTLWLGTPGLENITSEIRHWRRQMSSP